MLERIFLQLCICLEDIKNCIISLLCSKRASAKIPKHILAELARCFLPDIIAFYETAEGRTEYEIRKNEREELKAQKATSKP